MPVVGTPTPSGGDSLILDPTTEDAGNVEVVLSAEPYGLLEQSYPAPPIEPQWASSIDTEGARLAAQKHSNRQISLRVDALGAVALEDLESKVGKLLRDGGTLKRTLRSGLAIVFDVLTVSSYEPVFDYQHDLGQVTSVSLVLECKPYGRKDSAVTSAVHTAPANQPLVFTESVEGTWWAPASLRWTNGSGYARRWALWGVQSRYYDSAATAALFYEAESGDLQTGILAVGPAGASGSGDKVVQQSLTTTQTLAYGIQSTVPAYLSHVGTFRVYVRMRVDAASTGIAQVRLYYRTSSTPRLDYQTTDWVSVVDGVGATIEGKWVLVDLGMVTSPKARVGSERMQAFVQAKTVSGTATVYYDWAILVPVNEGWGEVTTAGGTGANGIQAIHDLDISDQGVLIQGDNDEWFEPQKWEGDELYVPPAGDENRTLRIITMLAGDTSGTPEPTSSVISTDDITDAASTAVLSYTPRYLTIPQA